jgi:hypothetical protein
MLSEKHGGAGAVRFTITYKPGLTLPKPGFNPKSGVVVTEFGSAKEALKFCDGLGASDYSLIDIKRNVSTIELGDLRLMAEKECVDANRT